ncbi:unnamed protein product [Allacma fusca]|uniref:Peptidase M20 dimerisation domain-containing protein n=1 Tax=Allacma fusca TaxID=39272 RepID=A0A8J2K8T7_9HEXA|nr:unnamed protein product [Allacma fusca]
MADSKKSTESQKKSTTDATKKASTDSQKKSTTDASLLPENLPEPLQNIFQLIDINKDRYISALREAVGIRSISAWPEARAEVVRMVTWAGTKLRELGFEVELRKIGDQTFEDGTVLALPPVIFASLGFDNRKKTLLIYGHLDVQPARKEDGWDSDPFLLSECHGQLFGRGATDDKGPVLGWLHAIECYQAMKLDLPVNIKFVLEAMEESGSEGLDDLLKAQKDKFLKNVDLVCISDNYWLGKNKPCLTYGLRGLCYFFLEVEGGIKDLHSGVFGGAVHEPMADLIWLLDQLTDQDGNILVPGIMDDVPEETSDEQELYDAIEFSLDDFRREIGVCQLRFPQSKAKTLMHRWRYPALSIHGIQGCFSDPGAKTVIPRKVIGKFSIRLVPNQTPDQVEKVVMAYIKEKWETRKSPNSMKIYLADDGVPAWTTNPFHPSYKAARTAVGYVFHTFPDMIREGGYMNQVLLLQETTKKNVLLLPMGASDDGAHSQNEKIDIRNYIEGTKVMAAYLYEVGQITEPLEEAKEEVRCS